jgi:TetR/AcrR family transcriptional regulator, regulator of biofilm formation and stress response
VPTGYKDEGRRERIAQAAISVVAERGVEGLTHRAVAAEAELPLGSTTYHFKSLDDLLATSIERAKEALDLRVEAWLADLPPDPDLPAALAAYLETATGPGRARSIAEHELYIAALRRPDLRRLADQWGEVIYRALARLTDRLTAEALAMAVDGIVLHSLFRETPPTAAEMELIFRRIVG